MHGLLQRAPQDSPCAAMVYRIAVTIASMAGWIGVPAMADYCASKFAAVGFDESLRNELKKLGKTGVHTTCVCPSFINTGMFDGIRVKFPDIFPMVEPEWAADQIIRAVETHSPVLIMPRSSYIAPICRGILPAVSFDAIAEFCGMHETMDDFKGRASTEKALR
jgi:all-trans-retinol dehydrogenase (NAD+)